MHVVDVGHVSKRAIFRDPEVDPMKISNFFEIFFSSKMVKNDVYGSRKYLERILGINLEQFKGTT